MGSADRQHHDRQSRSYCGVMVRKYWNGTSHDLITSTTPESHPIQSNSANSVLTIYCRLTDMYSVHDALLHRESLDDRQHHFDFFHSITRLNATMKTKKRLYSKQPTKKKPRDDISDYHCHRGYIYVYVFTVMLMSMLLFVVIAAGLR